MTNFGKMEMWESPETSSKELLVGTKLENEEARIVLEELDKNLPEEAVFEPKTILLEYLPPTVEQSEKDKKVKRRAPGATYLAIIKIGDGKNAHFASVEILLTGSLHASKGKKDALHPRSSINVFVSLKGLLSPTSLSDSFRLRLGEKLKPLIEAEGLPVEEILRLGTRPIHEPPPTKEVGGVEGGTPKPY